MLYGANALIAVAVKSPRFGTVKPSLAHCGPSAWGATRIGYGAMINVDGFAVPTLDQQEGSNGAPTVLVDQALRLADDGQPVFLAAATSRLPAPTVTKMQPLIPTKLKNYLPIEAPN
jgi:hypothetical protein